MLPNKKIKTAIHCKKKSAKANRMTQVQIHKRQVDLKRKKTDAYL